MKLWFWTHCESPFTRVSELPRIYAPAHADQTRSRWHEQIGGPTAADGILDRLVHNAHRIQMRVIRCAETEKRRMPNSHVAHDSRRIVR